MNSLKIVSTQSARIFRAPVGHHLGADFTNFRFVSSSADKTVAADSPSSRAATDGKQPALDNAEKSSRTRPPAKTVAQADEELRQKMSGLSGDGGDSGVEYEDGKPVSMKRSVKNNMFSAIALSSNPIVFANRLCEHVDTLKVTRWPPP
nr:hypothetical protein CFP56_12174 [Quercus suber]